MIQNIRIMCFFSDNSVIYQCGNIRSEGPATTMCQTALRRNAPAFCAIIEPADLKDIKLQCPYDRCKETGARQPGYTAQSKWTQNRTVQPGWRMDEARGDSSTEEGNDELGPPMIRIVRGELFSRFFFSFFRHDTFQSRRLRLESCAGLLVYDSRLYLLT